MYRATFLRNELSSTIYSFIHRIIKGRFTCKEKQIAIVRSIKHSLNQIIDLDNQNFRTIDKYEWSVILLERGKNVLYTFTRRRDILFSSKCMKLEFFVSLTWCGYMYVLHLIRCYIKCASPPCNTHVGTNLYIFAFLNCIEYSAHERTKYPGGRSTFVILQF